jgi:hypothetical protein
MRCRALDTECVADLGPSEPGVVCGPCRHLYGVRGRLEVLAFAFPLGVPPREIECRLRFDESLQLRAVLECRANDCVRVMTTPVGTVHVFADPPISVPMIAGPNPNRNKEI